MINKKATYFNAELCGLKICCLLKNQIIWLAERFEWIDYYIIKPLQFNLTEGFSYFCCFTIFVFYVIFVVVVHIYISGTCFYMVNVS